MLPKGKKQYSKMGEIMIHDDKLFFLNNIYSYCFTWKKQLWDVKSITCHLFVFVVRVVLYLLVKRTCVDHMFNNSFS